MYILTLCGPIFVGRNRKTHTATTTKKKNETKSEENKEHFVVQTRGLVVSDWILTTDSQGEYGHGNAYSYDNWFDLKEMYSLIG